MFSSVKNEWNITNFPTTCTIHTRIVVNIPHNEITARHSNTPNVSTCARYKYYYYIFYGAENLLHGQRDHPGIISVSHHGKSLPWWCLAVRKYGAWKQIKYSVMSEIVNISALLHEDKKKKKKDPGTFSQCQRGTVHLTFGPTNTPPLASVNDMA